MGEKRDRQLKSFERLLDIMDELRVKCPWDKKQTNESLRANTIEETYELCQAITDNNEEDIKKELGDLLLHIVFYSKIEDEKGVFDIEDVCNAICEKLIYRHPHVFGNTTADNTVQVEKNWEQLKLKEKGGNKTVLGGVPRALPALVKAYRIQDKARNVGFDWDKRGDVWNKVKEELKEFEAEVENNNPDNMEGEFGDLLFSLINAGRLYKINPENALELTNQKFIRRFGYIESALKEAGKDFKSTTPEEMESLWQRAKAEGL